MFDIEFKSVFKKLVCAHNLHTIFIGSSKIYPQLIRLCNNNLKKSFYLQVYLLSRDKIIQVQFYLVKYQIILKTTVLLFYQH